MCVSVSSEWVSVIFYFLSQTVGWFSMIVTHRGIMGGYKYMWESEMAMWGVFYLLS